MAGPGPVMQRNVGQQGADGALLPRGSYAANTARS